MSALCQSEYLQVEPQIIRSIAVEFPSAFFSILTSGLRLSVAYSLPRRGRAVSLLRDRQTQSHMSATDAHIKLCHTLMAADRMWEATIDMLTDAVYIFGNDKRLKKINRGGETLERANRSFLIGRRCCDMLWGLDAAGCMVDRAMTNGAEVEVELDESNKAKRPLKVRVVPQSRDQQQDSASGCVVIARDISELRHAEEEGSKNRAFLASLADLAPDEIYTLDANRRFTWMNQRAEVNSGLTRSVLLGHAFSMSRLRPSRIARATKRQSPLAEDPEWGISISFQYRLDSEPWMRNLEQKAGRTQIPLLDTPRPAVNDSVAAI